MLFTKFLAAALALATGALADAAGIIAVMEDIGSKSMELTTKVDEWNGGLLGTVPIIAVSTDLLVTTHKGTKVVEESAPLTDLEAFSIAVATITLSGEVEKAMQSIVAAKPKFDKLWLSPVIMLNLDLQKSATEEFADKLIAKVPEALRGTAQVLVDGILASFDTAIAVYH